MGEGDKLVIAGAKDTDSDKSLKKQDVKVLQEDILGLHDLNSLDDKSFSRKNINILYSLSAFSFLMLLGLILLLYIRLLLVLKNGNLVLLLTLKDVFSFY